MLQNLHFAKECKLHHLLLRRRPAAPQNVRDIAGDCSTRATTLRSYFLTLFKLSSTHSNIQGLNQLNLEGQPEHTAVAAPATAVAAAARLASKI
jgi:hypothetical protein